MKFSKTPYIRGLIIGVILLLLYLSLKSILGLSLWISFFISLIVILIPFVYFIFINKMKINELIKMGVSGGMAFTIIAWIGIKIFPPTVRRDLGDIIMPYINSFMMGLMFALSCIIFGLTVLMLNKI